MVTGILCFLLIQEYRWKGENGKAYSEIISSDGLGYYTYLPALFIDQNLSTQPIDNRYVLAYKQRSINKYYVGTALAMSPFFTLGYMLADKDERLDGLSPPFQKAISLAGLFYVILGLYFVRQLLQLYGIQDSTTALALIAITFGTNLLVYAVESPSHSHVYSFCFVSGFLYFTKRFFLTKTKPNLYLAAFLIGIVVLIRPLNGLVLLTIPFLAGSSEVLKRTIIQNLKSLLLASILFVSILSIQLLMNWAQTGDLLVWNYKNEGFYFQNPALWEVLFGFRKGWFIYTPLALLGLIGLIPLFKQNKFAYGTLFLFFVILIYFTSSWWNWYYGPSFGQRPFVEFYGLIALLLALWVHSTNSKSLRIILGSIGLLFIVLNLIQSYQYHHKIISSWDMNFEKYNYTFLKTNDRYRKCLGGNNDIWLYQPDPELIHSTTLDFETEPAGICDFSSKEFNATINVPLVSEVFAERGLFAEISLDRKEKELNSCSNALVAIEIRGLNNEVTHYNKFRINEIPDNPLEWKTYHYSVEIPPLNKATTSFKIYIWNKDKKAFYIDNFNVNLHRVN